MKIFATIESFGAHWRGRFVLAAAPIFFALSPVLLFERIFVRGDAIAILYPVAEYYRRILADGYSLLWNSLSLGGFPTFASVTGGFFSPVYFAFMRLLPAFDAYHWLLFIHLAAGAFLTAEFLRRDGFTLWPSLVGAWVFVFAQWHFAYDLPIVAGLAVMPALLLSVRLLATGFSWRWFALGASACAYGLLAVHYNFLLMTFVIAGVYAVFEICLAPAPRRPALAAGLAAMAIVGGLIGAVQILPAYTVAGYSARTQLAFTDVAIDSIRLPDLARFVDPYFKDPYLARGEPILYLGWLPLVFGLAALALRGGRVRFWTATAAVCALLAIAGSPLQRLLYEIPVIGGLRVPARWLWVGSFGFGYLAAAGLHHWDSIGQIRFVRRMARGAVWLGLAAVSLLVLATGIFAFWGERLIGFLQNEFGGSNPALPDGYYDSVVRGAAQGIMDNVNLMRLGVFAATAGLLASVWHLRRMSGKNFDRVKMAPAAAMIVAATFAAALAPYHPTAPGRVLADVPATASYLQAHPGRVLPFLAGQSKYQLLNVPHGQDPAEDASLDAALLAPNLNLYYGVASADYYDNLMPRRLARLLALVGSDRATAGERLADGEGTLEEKAARFSQQRYLLDLLGVRYVTSMIELDDFGFEKVLETRATRHNLPVYLYENTAVRPVVYLADAATAVEPDELRAYDQIIQSRPAGRDVIIECGSCQPTTGHAGGSAAVIGQSPGFWRVKVDTPESRWLVVSENFLPGWQATLDGAPAEIYFANSVFMALPVPPGRHIVELKYRLPW